MVHFFFCGISTPLKSLPYFNSLKDFQKSFPYKNFSHDDDASLKLVENNQI